MANSKVTLIFQWLLVVMAIFTWTSLAIAFAVFLYLDFGLLRQQFAQHALIITGLAGMGMAALALVIGFDQYTGKEPITFEAFTIKLRGASGPVVLWAIAFLTMVFGSKLLWISN
jgi:hypothetical protein